MELLDQTKAYLRRVLIDPSNRFAMVFDAVATLLVLFSVIVLPAYFMTELSFLTSHLLLLEQSIVTLFTVEYLVRIWLANKPFEYMTSSWGLIDLLAIIPFYIVKLGIISSPILISIFVLLRLLKLGQIYAGMRQRKNSLAENKHGSFVTLKEESIEYIAQKHWLLYLFKLWLPLMVMILTLLLFFLLWDFNSLEGLWLWLLGAFALIAFALLVYVYHQFYYDAMYITNQRIVLHEHHLFGLKHNEVNHLSITNVRPNTSGIFHYFFDSGDIEIDTTAHQGLFIFKNVDQPDVAVKFLSDYHQKSLEKISKH